MEKGLKPLYQHCTTGFVLHCVQGIGANCVTLPIIRLYVGIEWLYTNANLRGATTVVKLEDNGRIWGDIALNRESGEKGRGGPWRAVPCASFSSKFLCFKFKYIVYFLPVNQP